MGLFPSKEVPITQEVIKDARVLLDYVDRDSEGVLKEEEIMILQEMYQRKNSEVVNLLSKYDKNNDGSVDEQELRPLREGVKLIAQVQAIMDRYDTNKDGTLSESELKQMITDYEAKNGDAVKLLERWDRDKDGTINVKELEFLVNEVTTIQDVLRDSPLAYSRYTFTLPFLLGDVARYAAYTSDIGESFRPVMNKNLIRASYGVSWLYVMSDVAMEGRQQYIQTNGGDSVGLARTLTERVLFQTCASMAIPALLIHTTVHKVGDFMKWRGTTGALRRWGPTVAGLTIVPALPYMLDHPVEEGVHWLMSKVWPLKSGQVDPYDSHIHTHDVTKHGHAH